MSTNIRVVNKKGEQICQLDQIPIDTTVAEFKQKFIQQSRVSVNQNSNRVQKKLGPERLRFTIQSVDTKAPVVALSDKTKALSDYFQDPEVTLLFKDLGPQISWTTVFLVEYGGPIVITLLLLLFRKQIYGSDPELTYN